MQSVVLVWLARPSHLITQGAKGKGRSSTRLFRGGNLVFSSWNWDRELGLPLVGR